MYYLRHEESDLPGLATRLGQQGYIVRPFVECEQLLLALGEIGPDVLLVDDLQCISNKEQTQEAFFHIFNALHDAHKQLVFSSDTYPQHINGITQRLRSRLEWFRSASRLGGPPG